MPTFQRGTSATSQGRFFRTPTKQNPVITKTPDFDQETAAQQSARTGGLVDMNSAIGKRVDTALGQRNSLRDVAQPEQAQTAIRGADAFNLDTPETFAGTGDVRLENKPTVTGAAFNAAEEARMSDTKLADQQAANRAFFNGYAEQGITQDDLMRITGATDAMQAQQLINAGGFENQLEQLAANITIAGKEKDLLTEEEKIREDMRLAYQPQVDAATRAGVQAQESALRIQGRAGAGSKSGEQQQMLIERTDTIQQSISAQRRLEERMALAQARGGTEDEINAINQGIQSAKEQRQAAQDELDLLQAGLDEAAFGVASEKEKQLLKDSLEAAQTGFIYNNETGQYEKDPTFTSPQDYDFQLITDDFGNVTQVRTDKNTGKVVSSELGALGKMSAAAFKRQGGGGGGTGGGGLGGMTVAQVGEVANNKVEEAAQKYLELGFDEKEALKQAKKDVMENIGNIPKIKLQLDQNQLTLDIIDKMVTKLEKGKSSGIISSLTGIGRKPESATARAFMASLPFVASDAKDTARNIETIKANVGFDKLQSMRDASKTGGALGQVSEMENRLLQSVLGSMEIDQKTPQLIENLKQVRTSLIKIREAAEIDMQDDAGASSGTTTSGVKYTITNE